VIAYLARRIGLAAIVIVLVMIMLAVLVNLVPGDPAKVILGPHATPDLIAQVRSNMGLNDPVEVQVWHFIWHALHGDLGTDFISQSSVSSEVWPAFENTLALTMFGLVLSVGVGVPLGVLLATRAGGVLDAAIRSVTMVLLSSPVYVVGLVLLLILSVHWHVLPALGSGTFSDPVGYGKRLLMPGVALAVFWWAYLARVVRASMLEVLGQPYVRTARAYGLTERTVVYGVALKNALVPVSALVGLMLGYVLSGTVYVEIIFNRSGLGSLALGAVGNRDWPVVRAVVLIYAIAFIVGNLLADFGHRLLDPRVRVEEEREVFV
jgi:peptide/nickel transport system permease protein